VTCAANRARESIGGTVFLGGQNSLPITVDCGPALRKTGIRVMGDMPWGAHLCVFFETKADLLDTAATYFAAGFENHWREFCEYEQELDRSLAGQKMIVLCTYSLEASM
jgi:hypothetical protein